MKTFKLFLKPIEVKAESEEDAIDNFNEGEYNDKIELAYVLPEIPNQDMKGGKLK